MEISNLIKKQEEELDKLWVDVDFPHYHDHKLFLAKARKETAEAVCDKFIGDEYNGFLEKQNCSVEEVIEMSRIKKNKEIKKQIIESL